jgi:hypothetical protein
LASAASAASGDRFVAVDDVWVGEWTGPAVLRIRAGRVAVLRSVAEVPDGAVVRAGGVVLPGFCDSHGHLGLVDAGALVAGGIARVVDLGWDPVAVAAWAELAGAGSGANAPEGDARGSSGGGERMPEVSFAGAFLTGVGGYPSGRSWAPDAAVRQLRDVADARAAVAEMHGHGAGFAKLVLHAGDLPPESAPAPAAAPASTPATPPAPASARAHAGALTPAPASARAHAGALPPAPAPAGTRAEAAGGDGDGDVSGSGTGALPGLLSDEVARAVVDEAHRLGLVVVAHAEGPGQAARAERLGVDRLAHTPWTERLSDELITAMAGRMTWVSTLDIHGWGERTPEYAVALDNLTRFAAAGGRVLYGTDLGNGPLPTALNQRELDALVAAGLTLTQLLDALAPSDPSRHPAGDDRAAGGAIELGASVSWVPTRAPTAVADLPTWLQTARVVAAPALEETHA